MDAREVLERVRSLAAGGRIEVTSHARVRMRERGATFSDVRHALEHAHDCRAAEQVERWRVESTDLDGDELTLIVVLEDDVVVVTLF